MGPFCWASLDALDRLRDLPSSDRKAARLLYLALVEVAARRRDGKHAGFEATLAEVEAAAELSPPTFRKARAALERAKLLVVEGEDRGIRRWLISPSSENALHLKGKAFSSQPSRERIDVKETEKEPSVEGLFDPGGSNGAAPVERIFERWQTIVPGKSGCRLTEGRRRRIRARLRSFDEATLLRAVEQAARDPFLNGENDRGRPFNDFRTIFRDDEKVEELLEDAARAPQRRNGAAKQERVGRFMDALESFTKEG